MWLMDRSYFETTACPTIKRSMDTFHGLNAVQQLSCVHRVAQRSSEGEQKRPDSRAVQRHSEAKDARTHDGCDGDGCPLWQRLDSGHRIVVGNSEEAVMRDLLVA